MRTEAERREAARARDRIGGRRSAGKQAGAGQDAVMVGIEDAIVDADGQPEIIRVDDKAAPHRYRSASRNTWAATIPSTRYSFHGFPLVRSCSTSNRFSNVVCSSCTITHVSATPGGSPPADNERALMSGRPWRCR